MKQNRERVAGLDVHRDTVVACCRVPGTRRDFKTIKRSFRTTSSELTNLSEWLLEAGVTTVATEATGVYWKPVVRHEALFDCEGMKGPLLRAVAAV